MLAPYVNSSLLHNQHLHFIHLALSLSGCHQKFFFRTSKIHSSCHFLSHSQFRFSFLLVFPHLPRPSFLFPLFHKKIRIKFSDSISPFLWLFSAVLLLTSFSPPMERGGGGLVVKRLLTLLHRFEKNRRKVLNDDWERRGERGVEGKAN